jgi:prepilin-type N-terminal cleavage/methylation domain-containing protein
MFINIKKLFLIKNNKGFTLVELIVGVALIGIISVLVLTVLSTGAMLALKSGENTKKR